MDEEKYMKSIYKLHDKCQQIQRENERFVARLHYIKKLTKRQQKDVVLLKSRLDLYNDEWRTAQPCTKVRRVVKKNKTSGTTSGPSATTANFSVSTANGGCVAAPITKRKRSSQTGSAKRQSEGKANPELLWKDWSTEMETHTIVRGNINKDTHTYFTE